MNPTNMDIVDLDALCSLEDALHNAASLVECLPGSAIFRERDRRLSVGGRCIAEVRRTEQRWAQDKLGIWGRPRFGG